MYSLSQINSLNPTHFSKILNSPKYSPLMTKLMENVSLLPMTPINLMILKESLAHKILKASEIKLNHLMNSSNIHNKLPHKYHSHPIYNPCPSHHYKHPTHKYNKYNQVIYIYIYIYTVSSNHFFRNIDNYIISTEICIFTIYILVQFII